MTRQQPRSDDIQHHNHEIQSVTDDALMRHIHWNADGLIPVVVQEKDTNSVLMLAWMNKEALTNTLVTRQGTYFSRSRQKLWIKGETSGHWQHVHQVLLDCDADTILLIIEQIGPACHRDTHSCFDGGEIPLPAPAK